MKSDALSARVGGRTLLSGIGFEARAGEVTAIIGPNGAGKTTLLRCLTGDLAYRGRITLNGVDLRSLSGVDLARRRAVLPQAVRVAFPFTVAEIVGLGLLHGGEEAEARIERLLAEVDLAGYGPRRYGQLSGGEQQRAQLARVLGQIGAPAGPDGPRWLLLDEPVSSLDIGHQAMVMQRLRAFAAQGGGVIAVMHDLNLTALHCDRIAVIAGGRLRAQGTPDEIITDTVLSDAYGCTIRTRAVPENDRPYILPQPVS